MKAKAHPPRPSGMNKLEQAWANQLELAKRAGDVIEYRYEAIKLRLADKTFYTPDFMVIQNDGTIRFDETKGFMRDDANVKIKVAASQYERFRFRLIRKIKGEWKIIDY